MREFAPFIFFIAVASSGMFYGVASRGGRSVDAPTGAPALRPADPAGKPDAGTRGGEAQGSQAHDRPFARLIREFYGLPLAKLGTSTANSQDAAKAVKEDLLKRGRPEWIHFMIALLSDPIESSADHFDPFLEAMQRAFEAEGLLIDRKYLPWTKGIGGGGPMDAEPIYRTEPAVLLFRKAQPKSAGGPTELVVVLVVGENPIYGIHKEALHRALSDVVAWRYDTMQQNAEQNPAAPSARHIQILGPTYSGSAYSLQAALCSWQAGRENDLFVEILSGSAMASSNKTYLELAIPGPGTTGAMLVNFHSCSLQSSELRDVFINKYLRDRLGVEDRDIVLLTESNTAYGASGRDETQKIPGEDYILNVTYPLQIGSTRGAYEQQNLVPFPSTADGVRFNSGIELRLGPNPRANDLPPTFSSATAAYVERVVLTILDAVRRENRRYVGLMGSSVEDRLFLAQLLYYRCPNVQLFCLDNNLLYTHPKYNRFLEGMLIASPYPLYPRHVQDPRFRLTTYPSDEAAGMYLACRVVIGRLLRDRPGGRLEWDYVSPFALDVRSSHGSDDPESVSRPSVWVLQVGRNNILPLAVLETNPEMYKDNNLKQLGHAAYTWRLDQRWQELRRDELVAEANRLQMGGIDFGSDDQAASRNGTAEEHDRPRLYGPSVIYLCGVTTSSLLILALASLAFAKLRSDSARRYTGSSTPANIHSAGDVNPCAEPPVITEADRQRMIRRFEWYGFIALSLLVQIVVAAPVVIALTIGHAGGAGVRISEWTIFVVAASGGLAILALLLRVLAELFSSNTYRDIWRYRLLRMRARAGERSSLLRAFWCGAESMWEVWAVPIICVATSLAAVALLVVGLFSLNRGERFFLAEQVAMPAARLSPFVALASFLVGFGLVQATRILRAERTNSSRIEQLIAWKQPASRWAAVRDAARAIEMVERQAAIPDYLLARGLVIVAVVMLTAGFLGMEGRLTALPGGLEWSLRVAALGLTLLTVCFISSSGAFRHAWNRFLENFPASQWGDSFSNISPRVREALKNRLFVSMPTACPVADDGSDSERIKRVAETVLTQLGSPIPTSRPLQALVDVDAAPASDDQRRQQHINIGFTLLEMLKHEQVRTRLGPEYVSAAIRQTRGALAPEIASVTGYLMSQLSRRLIATLVLALLLMFALQSYPFRPRRFLLLLESGILLAAVGSAVWAYLAVNRNETLSAMAGARSGLTLDMRLVYETALFLGIPLLTVLSLHFPEFSDFFSSAANAFKGVKL